MTTSIPVRAERSDDIPHIHELTRRAFAESELGHHGEAEIVDRLRSACVNSISLVADLDGQVVGHILFTPATIATAEHRVEGMGLAPMSVLPEFQRTGVGTALVETGLQLLQERSLPFVVVLGHPEYYPRFGFVRASEHRITCEFENIPDDLFMIRVFDEKAIADVTGGVATYRPEFRGD